MIYTPTMEMSGPIEESLLLVRRLDRVMLELTTRCNLKCTYCTISRPWHISRELDLSEFSALVAEMQRLEVKSVQISGAGETTTLKGWDLYLAELLDAGFEVTIISNLAKPLQERTVHSLSRCVEISTSCDTVNPDVFAAIRSGGDLRVFLQNIHRIRARALAEDRRAPRLVWNCVANDKVIFDIVEWVSTGISAGVDHFQISEMTWLPDLDNAFCTAPIGTLSSEDLARAKEIVGRAEQLASAAGKAFTVLPAVREVLAGNRSVIRSIPVSIEHLDGKVARVNNRTWKEFLDGSASPETATPLEAPPGTTRNCIRPWVEADVWATGKVTPCDLHVGVSPVTDGGLLQAMNSPHLVQIRHNLLCGTLTAPCSRCPMMELTEPHVLRQRLLALGLGSDVNAGEAVAASGGFAARAI